MEKSKTVLLIAFLLILAGITIGQIREISEVEYNAARNRAQSNFEKLAYKQQTNTEKFKDGKLISSQISTEINLPPGKNSWTNVETVDGKTTKIELIRIGKTQYQRVDDSKWMKFENSSETIPTIPSLSDGINDIKKYTVEATSFNKQSVNIYELTMIYKFSPNISHVYRCWINKDDLRVKDEEIEIDLSSGNIINRSISTKEYNPKNLTITAPIIKYKILGKRLK